MTQEMFEKEFAMLTQKMVSLCVDKSHDYAGVTDPLSNLRECERAGIPAWKGIIAMRMADKMSRLLTFCKQEEMKVNNESLTDTLLDLANYCLLAILIYQENREKNSSKIKENIVLTTNNGL